MRKIGIYLVVAAVFMLFNSSAWVNLTLVRPSEIMLPESIRSLVVVDRTMQEDVPQNRLEQVLTGEFFQQDEQAVIQVAEGFIRACSELDRYHVVRAEEKQIGNGAKNTFPTTMDWNEVDDLCRRYETDAILALEIFDSDFIVTHSPVKIDTKNELGIPVIRLEYHAVGVAVIHFGVRIYDAVNRVILDEYQTTQRVNFEANANSVQDALNQIIDKVQAVNQVSFDAGYNYASRITPTYYRATRYFYDKPMKKLGAGVRMSEVADWKGAIDAWMDVVENGKKKHAGRAAFNIAVAYEVLGNLEEAKKWTSKSYTEFEDKEANDYYKVISNRIREERIVDNQLTRDD